MKFERPTSSRTDGQREDVIALQSYLLTKHEHALHRALSWPRWPASRVAMDRVLDAARQLAQVVGGVDHVGPGTPSGAIVVNGTNQELEVRRPTLIHALRAMLSYDPLTGILRWRASPARRVKVGDEAGDRSGDYRRIRFSGLRLPAHHVAWVLFYGKWARSKIDHANGVGTDNRIVNLRLATHGQNRANSVSQSAYGVKGVCQERNGRWRAQIWRDGALCGLGTFDTMEEAAAVFASEHRKQHGEFSFTGSARQPSEAQHCCTNTPSPYRVSPRRAR